MEEMIIKIGCAAMAVVLIAQHVRLDRQTREIKRLKKYISSAQNATIGVLEREEHIIHSINDLEKRLSAVEAGWWGRIKKRLLK